MNPTVEKDLIELAQRGDEGAFEKLLVEALPKLKAFLTSQYPLQPTDIDDIVQAASVKVWKKIDRFRNESAFATWFYIILRNEAIDFIKRRKFIEEREVPARNFFYQEVDYEHLDSAEQILEDTAATMLEKKETIEIYRKMIEEVLSELSPKHSQIINLAMNEGKTYREIAEILNIPIGSVMSRLFFARKEAQKHIIQYARRNAIQLGCLGRCIESSLP